MIQRLTSSSLSFGLKELKPVRDMYDAKMNDNLSTAVKQSEIALNTTQPPKKHITMHGSNPQKLDVVA